MRNTQGEQSISPNSADILTARSRSPYESNRSNSRSPFEKDGFAIPTPPQPGSLRRGSTFVKQTNRHNEHDRRMSAPELPPIITHGKAISIPQSSYGNGTNANGNSGTSFPETTNGVTKTVIRRTEKPEKISIDSPVDSRLKSSPLSPKSASSGGSGHGTPGSLSSRSGQSNPKNENMRVNRTKSWVAPDSGTSPTKLETLFERQQITINSNSNKKHLKGTSQKIYSGLRRNSTQGDLSRRTKAVLPRNLSDPKMHRNNDTRGYSRSSKPPHHPSHHHQTTKRLDSRGDTDKSKNDSRHNSGKNSSSNLSQERLYTLEAMGRQESSATETTAADEDEDDAFERDRIIQWLIGVESSAEEPPLQPDIEDDPPQTDTAIHIVYEGD